MKSLLLFLGTWVRERMGSVGWKKAMAKVVFTNWGHQRAFDDALLAFTQAEERVKLLEKDMETLAKTPAFASVVGALQCLKGVALTSTLTVFETLTPGRPLPPGLEVLTPSLKTQFEQNYARTASNATSVYRTLFPKAMVLERAFARAGGVLVAGTDPTAGGGVIPGFANQRQLELMVEAGFSPLEAIAIGTRNGARFLGRDGRIGTIAAGKQADLMVVAGDPSRVIADARKVETVFKRGVGFDSQKLIQSVSGRVGIW